LNADRTRPESRATHGTAPDGTAPDGTAPDAARPRRSGLVQERSRRTRQELVDAALRLWTERGFEHGVADTTVEEIVREAGVTKGTFYFHFAHKEDILLELGWATGVALQKDARRVVDAGMPVDNALDTVLAALARRIASTPRTVVSRTLTEFYRQRGPEIDAASAQHGFQVAFEIVLERGRDCGELPADCDPPQLAAMLLWLALGCMNRWTDGHEIDIAAEMRALGRFVLAGARALAADDRGSTI
jgi:AcrR family transcriptional regulator